MGSKVNHRFMHSWNFEDRGMNMVVTAKKNGGLRFRFLLNGEKVDFFLTKNERDILHELVCAGQIEVERNEAVNDLLAEKIFQMFGVHGATVVNMDDLPF